MIIACPKCKVKFKVDDNKIPSYGRMVQCSKCSHKWKEHGISEQSSNFGKIIFVTAIIVIGFILIFIGSIIIFGNQIPLPELLSTWIENLGIPINGGELFGRKYER